MEEQVRRLVDKLWQRLQDAPAGHRVLVAVGGIPGSGKTTLARAVVAGVNRRAAAEVAIVVPMDGFHLTRAQLSAMPDPARAHARRGAAFTFDGEAFARLVQALRAGDGEGGDVGGDVGGDADGDAGATIFAPSFDHAVKDPVPDAIAIGPHHRIVVFEGNYVCLDRPPWRAAAALMDERWFVDAPDLAAVRARLVRRHVAAGIAADAAAAGRRADENDLVNGAEIVAGRLADVDEVIVSREDESWV